MEFATVQINICIGAITIVFPYSLRTCDSIENSWDSHFHILPVAYIILHYKMLVLSCDVNKQ